jgi:protein phosphatase
MTTSSATEPATTGFAHATNADVAPRAHRALTANAFGMTDKGRVRDSNEDQFLSAELTKGMRIWQTSLTEPKRQLGIERGHLFLVADGMGGHSAGEEASALAVAAVEQFTLNTFKWFFDADEPAAKRVLAQFVMALRHADARILEESTEHPELRGMGTTLTMAFQLDAQLCVVHVGDSRAYIYGDDTLYQLTHDDTVIAEMVRQGALNPEQVAGHRLRHVITNVVGGSEAVVHVEAHALEVHDGDRLLLCSDGLTEMVPDAAIAAVLAAETDSETACRRLVAQANAAGGRDNITVLIVRFEAAETVE